MTSEKQARRYFISGRVQGVGYRYFAAQSASLIGVAGYARNLDDGRVEVYAIGAPEQLNELVGRLWKGPPWAEVRAVEQQEAAVEKRSGFRVEQ